MLRYLLASLVLVLMEGTRSVTAFTAPGLLPARAAGLARLCGRSVPGGQGTKQRLALDRGVLSRPMGSAMSASPSAPSATAESEMVGSGDRLDSVPWEESIAGPDHDLLYMPFMDWQLKYMMEHLDVSDAPMTKEHSYQEDPVKKNRIESWNFQSSEFRKIRLTYLDAGKKTQVFNSVWYPRYSYDAPPLGIDFISFGEKNVLCVMDFQPLLQDEDYLKKYIDPLIPMRNRYEALCGRMTERFYDEKEFFSSQLLFGRFDNPQPIKESLFPAMCEYIEHYVKMVKDLEPNEDPAFMARVEELHGKYDQYSAEKDPAAALFAANWGNEWAESFVYDFLFDKATVPPEGCKFIKPGPSSKQQKLQQKEEKE